MTSQEVARRAGIAPGSYSCLENGWYKINLDNLFRILQVLKANVKEVWPAVEGMDGSLTDDEYLLRVTEQALASQHREVEMDDVFQAIVATFEVSKDKLLSQYRWQRLTEARGAAGILVKDMTNLSLTSLCRTLGCSISSMSHLVRRTSERMLDDEALAQKYQDARQELERLITSKESGKRRAG